MMPEPPPEDPEDAQARWGRVWRGRMLALMLSMAFAGGALFGLLAGSLGLPGVWWAPMVLAATGGFWLLTRSRR